jgi:transmembrane sensor
MSRMEHPGERKTLLIKAGAATWLARMRADDRTQEDEATFREWLAADPAHAAAFEAMNGVWDVAGPAPRDLRGRLPAEDGISRRAVMAGVFVAAGAGGTFALTQMAQADVYRTEVGEQKHALLPDGTELFLDTDTKLVVNLRKRLRHVVLEYGCANFRVAPDTRRPFTVNAAGSIIQGTQSTFDVRRDGDRVSVVLIQGRATVESIAQEPARVLADGERLVYTPHKTIKRDKPNLLPLLAWHTGQALFQGETLLEAASEMNRYSDLKLVVADDRVENMKVSGLYRVGDNAIFAQALEQLLPVSIRQFEDRIEITGDEAELTKI